MKTIKKILMVAIVAMGLVSCEETIFPHKIKDEPKIEFAEKSITADAAGNEELIVMLNSTGVDDATIRLIDNYEVDENGDRIALEPWAEIVKVIDNYEEGATRALARWDSAIVVRVKPNDSGKERKAVISARSFMISATIDLTQSAE